MKKIPLTQGQFALVDDDDYKELIQHKWCVSKARRGFIAVRGKSNKLILMHRLIMNAPKNLQVDHINHNGLDNRRYNLRLATNSQNQYNQISHQNTSSVLKGVCWHKARQKWAASIKLDYKKYHLGLFNDETKAAKAYDAKAKELFGEFARTNF